MTFLLACSGAADRRFGSMQQIVPSSGTNGLLYRGIVLGGVHDAPVQQRRLVIASGQGILYADLANMLIFGASGDLIDQPVGFVASYCSQISASIPVGWRASRKAGNARGSLPGIR